MIKEEKKITKKELKELKKTLTILSSPAFQTIMVKCAKRWPDSVAQPKKRPFLLLRRKNRKGKVVIDHYGY